MAPGESRHYGFGSTNAKRRGPWRWRRRLACWAAAGTALAAWPALAQQPGVELQIESKSLELGESASVQLVCANMGVPSSPEASVPEGLDLKLLNATPSSSSFTQIINGRMSRRTTYTYSMQLTAMAVGTHTLGPINVEADGATYQTQPVTIVVNATDNRSTPRGERYIYAEVDVEPLSVYVSESVLAKLTIGIRKVEINGRLFEIDLLRKVLDQGRSQFSVFADGDVRKTELQIPDSTGVRHRYEVFHVTKRVRADDVGTLQIGPVFLKANYPTRIRRGFFGGYEVAQARKETARVPAVSVTVKTPPDEGRPDAYTGAIGRFSMAVSAKPERVEQGRPVTLAITITGDPLDGIAGPNLNVQPELASRFDYTKDELVGDKEGNAKVFRRAIFPKQIGVQTIPSIRWSYFDARKERYVTLNSKPISITVDPPSTSQAAVPILEAPGAQPEATSLTVLTGGISPNYVDADTVLADQSFTLSVPWGATLVLSPLAWLVIALQVRHRARLRGDVGLARRRRAGRKAQAQLHRVVSQGDSSRKLPALGEVLTAYVADRFNLGPGTLTPTDVRSVLAEHRVPETLATEIVDFLKSCDESRYAGNSRTTQPIEQSVAEVAGWVTRIERELR